MRDLDTLLGALTDRLLQAEARIEELERHETPGALAFGWAGAVGMLQMLPGLVGLWPGAGIRGSDRNGVADMSGNGLHLARNGGASIGDSSVSELVPAMFFNGINAYFSHADAAAFDISGTETVVQRSPPYRGLTLGGWFYFDNATIAADEFLIGKAQSGLGATTCYHMFRRASDEKIVFFVSDGTIVGVGGEVVDTVGWRFLVARYSPDSELKLWVDEVATTNTSSIPAQLQNTTENFTIGADSTGANFFNGLASLCFLCAAAVPDVMIETFYQYSKGLFGL